MRINGTYIGGFYAHTEDSPVLLNRKLEIYVTKTKVKFYLFNSGNLEWHKEYNVIYNCSVKYKNNLIEVITITIANILRTYKLKVQHNIYKIPDTLITHRNLDDSKGDTEIFNADYGYYEKDKCGVIKYYGGLTGQGMVYKNLKAWNTGNEVIYIGEHELNDLNDGLTCTLWTRDSWVKWVKLQIEYNYKDHEDYSAIIACDDFIEMLAYDCLQNADCQDLSTLFDDYDYNNDWVLNNWDEYKKTHKL